MASAQKSVRTTAYNYLRKGKLDRAKEYIDKAVDNEKTMNDPKTWFYYGNIYIQLATTQDEAYKDLDAEALKKAYNGYNKCMELDTKKAYYPQILQDMVVISNNYYAKGLKFFNAEDFSNAYTEFNQAISVNKAIDNIDSLAIYAASMSAYSAKLYDEAKAGYTELMEMGYNNAGVYSDLANIYKEEGDLAKAKEVLQTGIEKYPNEASILFAKINILLEENRYEEVIQSLEEAIKLAPENYTLYFVQGQSFEQMKQLDKAQAAYEKALEIKPDYSDALFNMGALHYNKAVEIYANANDLPLDATDEYEKMTANAKKYFLDAQPYFEKVLVLIPGDENIISSLTQIYQKTNQLDKLAELKNK